MIFTTQTSRTFLLAFVTAQVAARANSHVSALVAIEIVANKAAGHSNVVQRSVIVTCLAELCPTQPATQQKVFVLTGRAPNPLAFMAFVRSTMATGPFPTIEACLDTRGTNAIWTYITQLTEFRDGIYAVRAKKSVAMFTCLQGLRVLFTIQIVRIQMKGIIHRRTLDTSIKGSLSV
mmetsp:Transcript_29977/g.69139  ORF Transcript_29977/g.69139 Transcript_29977/m.69139 type:complete len:177 (-) Transcript_29977:613-1143(-)